MKIIHFTDTHILGHDDTELHGLLPNQRAQAIIAHINKKHSDAAFCIITGDLTHRGLPEQYTCFKQIVQMSVPPVFSIVGNHDNRDHYKAAFPDTQTDSKGFVQYCIDTEVGKFLFLDTLLPNSNIGVYCAERAKWLKQQLELSDGAPIYLVLHHPPFDIHLSFLDRMRLMDDAAFWDILSPYKHQIRHMFMGHVHRTISGNWRGISYSMLKSTNHQVSLDFNAQKFSFRKESPEYAVIQITEQSVLVFNQSIKV